MHKKKTNDKKIPEFKSYEEMAEFWDTNDITDFWDQTEPAQFDVSPQVRSKIT